MIKLTKEEREKIRNAVMQAEKKTSGEFVTVIARQSDTYFYIPLLWAAILSILTAPVMFFIFDIHDGMLIFQVQIIVLILLFLLFQISAIKVALVPGSLKRSMAQKMAFEQFYLQGVSGTKERAGILFYVSYAEKYVEILADEGINKLVGNEQWQNIVDEFIVLVKQGKICDGFTAAIENCTAILSRHFPLKEGDVNELSDKLIEL